MEKPGDTRKRGDIIAEVETQKDLSKLRYSMKASLINSHSGRNKSSCRNRHGTTTAERRFFRYKKRKRSCPIATNRRKTIKSTPVSTAEIRKIKVSPLARRIAEENHIKLESVKGTGPDEPLPKKMSIT
jgi:pyruvate dehydrogenase E2 component (dihydrolipoamide acetyltransferase)